MKNASSYYMLIHVSSSVFNQEGTNPLRKEAHDSEGVLRVNEEEND